MGRIKYLSIIFLLISPLLLFSYINLSKTSIQIKEYPDAWAKVDSLEKVGLFKSAHEVVDQIYAQAKKDKDQPQIVRTLIYKAKYITHIEENAPIKTIELFNEEIKKAEFPLDQFLMSIQADLYWKYYERNRWQILNRGEVAGRPEDITTWSGRDFVEKVIELYKGSLENSDSLKKIPVRSFEPVLVTQPSSEKYRPTLYDFLAHRVIDLFKNEEANIRKPYYAFKMDYISVFHPPANFVRQDYKTRDTTSLKYQALILFQDLTEFHLKDTANAAPLVMITLERLKFAHQHAVVQNKGALYKQALEELLKETNETELEADILLHLATYRFELGQNYDPLTSDNFKWEKSVALKLLKDAEEKNPDSIVAKQIEALKAQILNKQLQVMVEEVNLPGKPFRSSVAYTNIDNLYFKAIRLNDSIRNKMLKDQREDSMIVLVRRLPTHSQWQIDIPNDHDHQYHRVEVKMEPLPKGEYLIVASPDQHFKDSIIAYGTTTISEIGYVKRNIENGQSAIYVFDRHSGKTISGAKVALHKRLYNYTGREHYYQLQKTLTTDKEGKVTFKTDKNHNDYQILISYKKDTLPVNEYFYSYYNPREKPKKSTRTFFFTDRLIYRPGQTIYFKGLMLEKIDKDYSILTKARTTVGFYDVNGQKIAEQSFVTNEYGTFNGSFTAPSGLTGRMQIRNESNGTFISVEEYKRPKFEVKFEPVKELFRLNDSVKVKGTATAYAGATIDNATVHYRVVRRTNYPFIFFRYSRMFPSEEMEITSGVAETDSAGNFTVTFKAIPDPSVDPKTKPQFTYAVEASVTDIAGETQSANTSVNVGYIAFNIDLDIPSSVNRDSLLKFGIKTVNLNGQPEGADVKIAIYKLEDQKRVLRDRLWPRPDTFIYSQKQFYDLFPHDVYDDENDHTTWNREKQVWTNSFNTGTINEVIIPEARSWSTGAYEVEITATDKFGEKVTISRYYTFFDMDKNELAVPKIFWSHDLKTKAEPGETALFAIGTSTSDLYVLYEIEHEQKIIYSEWVKLNKEIRKISVPIKEEYRGNIFVHFSTVKYGRFISETKSIIVPWTNKDLKLEFSTFRDKLSPGAEETWTVKVTGDKGEKVAVEMVAAMYDASLDALAPHNWNFSIYPSNPSSYRFSSNKSFSAVSFNLINERHRYYDRAIRLFDQLNWFGFYFGQNYYRGYAHADGVSLQDAVESEAQIAGSKKEARTMAAAPPPAADVAATEESAQELNVIEVAELDDVPMRENLNETAFFFPQLMTDEEGNISFTFTMPEALTRWNFMGFAHTKDLKFGFLKGSTITQKELMVQPNAPRFLREGDEITISSKISNLIENSMTGTARLELFDAITNKPLNIITNSEKGFTANAKQSTAVSWAITVPENVNAIQYRIVAKAGNFSDGEAAVLPVLSNRILVTETLPFQVLSNQTKTYSIDKLLNQRSSTLVHHKLTLEFTGNPAWYAVQALPYLMEYPYECSEQVFNRFYSNSLATFTVNSNPGIKKVFDQWRNTDALVSNLEKNQQLKSVLLEETPWLLQGKNETEQKKRIALLFDMNKMAGERAASIRKLQQLQTSNGGWPWFAGMPDDRYITQYIVAGIGHLQKLDPTTLQDPTLQQMIRRAVEYIDARNVEDHKRHIEKGKEKTVLGNQLNINYLYARSFFPEIPMSKEATAARDYFMKKVKENWVKQNKYLQGMIALAFHRMDNTSALPNNILASLKETAINHEELGVYWKSNTNGWYWYEAPIETQALLIEAFETISRDRAMVDGMKLWLLKQKQVQHWPTTKATSEAVYALLLSGSDWLSDQPEVIISLGNKTINTASDNIKKEAGTGYFQMDYHKAEVQPAMGKITVEKKGEGVSWGAVYWQYFEDLDKITAHQSPLQVKKTLFVQKDSDTGPVMLPVSDTTSLNVGDKLVVRLVVKTDRDMEYIHLKDMRAAGFEPLNVLSGYKFRSGLGYYESTKDASTNFFFSRLPKGTHVLDYNLVVSQKGNFSNGIATIQSMYAPEFAAHSEGVRVRVR